MRAFLFGDLDEEDLLEEDLPREAEDENFLMKIL